MKFQFFKLEVRLKKKRRVEEMEKRRIDAIILKENIISLAGSMSRIYNRRKLMEKNLRKENR